MANGIEFVGRDTGFDVRCGDIQDLSCELSSRILFSRQSVAVMVFFGFQCF